MMKIPRNATHKAVGYAYPTSTSASRFGFAKVGCWIIQTMEGSKPPKALAGFQYRAQAMDKAEAIALPWSRHTHREESAK